LSHAIGFLQNRDKVKLTLQFRGREVAFADAGRKVIERIINGGSIPAEKGVTPSQWTAQYEKETKQWAEIAKAVNAKLE
jgi:translation initiation factor IF-3